MTHILSTLKVAAIGALSLSISACTSHTHPGYGYNDSQNYNQSSAYHASSTWTESRYGTATLSSGCGVPVQCGNYIYARPQMVYTVPASVTHNYNYPDNNYTPPEVIQTQPAPEPYTPVIEAPVIYTPPAPPQSYPTPTAPDPLPWLPPKK